ncbi:protein tipE isoform X1 [Anopheles aquasalis]|uniref:protein tipE isoform X1 n=1 Tax=Anopheles aquasalis TaxID=42839 RepID=UPI00215A8487|nr:protein tipE isoform X1 [Anopheles aquasalis]XP_050085949.1 protein tipE isoform X1 [Anopheles aquasalis]
MDEEIVPRTFREKALFYTTAFFILLGTFSLFAFLFLVPFVIEPAFQTIFMQFDESPALCVTAYNEHLHGAKNCSWTSCREGCTKDIYECHQIRVNYKTAAQLAAAAAREEAAAVAAAAAGELLEATSVASAAAGSGSGVTKAIGDSSVSGESSKDSSVASSSNSVDSPTATVARKPIATSDAASSSGGNGNGAAAAPGVPPGAGAGGGGGNSRYANPLFRFKRAVRAADYDYSDLLLDDNLNGGGGGGGGGMGDGRTGFKSSLIDEENAFIEYPEEMTGLMGNNSEWYFTGARLYPNVKGCGYPPMLNCTIWTKRYWTIGTNFTCYYSRVDPELVISDLDMWQNTLNLVFAMAIPIPSFIISVIYLAFAYFVIFNEDEEAALLDKNGEEEATEDELADTDEGNDNKINNENEGEVVVTANHINEKQQQNHTGSTDDGGGGGGGDVNTTVTTPIQPLQPNGTVNNSMNNTNTTATTNTNGSSKPITPNSTSDLNSFGHQLKVKMADEMSRESIDGGGGGGGGLLSNSVSLQGNLSKTMTTSISTPPGPIAAV